MNLEELETALEEVLPGGYQIDTDDEGQIVIYTNLTENEDGELVEFEEDLDPDLCEDCDLESYDESDGED